jgi:uncharacterized protein (UPF0179 family)
MVYTEEKDPRVMLRESEKDGYVSKGFGYYINCETCPYYKECWNAFEGGHNYIDQVSGECVNRYTYDGKEEFLKEKEGL